MTNQRDVPYRKDSAWLNVAQILQHSSCRLLNVGFDAGPITARGSWVLRLLMLETTRETWRGIRLHLYLKKSLIISGFVHIYIKD